MVVGEGFVGRGGGLDVGGEVGLEGGEVGVDKGGRGEAEEGYCL